MVKGGEIGGFGGGWLEQPRQRLGAQRAGLSLGVPSCPEPPGVPRGGTGAVLGRCQDGASTMLGRLELGDADLAVAAGVDGLEDGAQLLVCEAAAAGAVDRRLGGELCPRGDHF